MFFHIEVGPVVERYMGLPVAVDERFEVYVDGRPYTTLFAMPAGLEYAVVGSLIRDGLSPSDVAAVSVGRGRIDVKLAREVPVAEVRVEDCAVLAQQGLRVDSRLKVSWRDLQAIYADFNPRTASVALGIAAHTAGIYDLKSRRAVVAHDTSRHTAVLKAIGAAVAHSLEPSSSVAITTGRASSDMVVTLARAGVPIAISMRGPLRSGITAALALGVTLVANLRRGEKARGLIPLTYPARIADRELAAEPHG